MLAYASAGERLDVGDVISTGCMPTCCGLELDRWIEPGNVVELEIDCSACDREQVVSEVRDWLRASRRV